MDFIVQSCNFSRRINILGEMIFSIRQSYVKGKMCNVLRQINIINLVLPWDEQDFD